MNQMAPVHHKTVLGRDGVEVSYGELRGLAYLACNSQSKDYYPVDPSRGYRLISRLQ